MNSNEEKKYQELWNAVLEKIKESKLYDDAIYTTYIEPTNLFRINGNVALITVPNNVSNSIISGNLDQWKQCFAQAAGNEYTLQLILHKDVEKMMPTIFMLTPYITACVSMDYYNELLNDFLTNVLGIGNDDNPEA